MNRNHTPDKMPFFLPAREHAGVPGVEKAGRGDGSLSGVFWGGFVKKHIALKDHFTYGRLLSFTLPSIAMMIFTSVYGVVDGFFISNFAGKTPFAAVNFIMPYLMILGTLGFMFGSGGSALVASAMGMGDTKRANELFSLLVAVSAGLGMIVALAGLLTLRSLAAALGAEGEMLEDCVAYGRIIVRAVPAFILQMEFQSFFVTAEKPGLGLATTVASGVANMVLDALLVAVFPFGILGAASATALSQLLGALIPLIYFSRPNSSLLRLGKTRFDARAVLRACVNGSSEFMNNISMSLVGMLYNVQLLRYAGENGVSAYGVLMYVSMIFSAAFIGYSMGSAPVVSFHFGAQDRAELRSLLQKSLVIIGLFSLGMVLAAQLLARPLALLYVSYDTELLELTARAMGIYSLAFLFMGYAIYASGFFTALNDGLTSALISFLRTLVFQAAAVLILPLLWKVDGIWWSLVVAEGMAVAMSGVFLLGKRPRYGY